MSGLLLPASALGCGEGRLLCRKCGYGKMLVEEPLVFQGEKQGVAPSGITQNGSSCRDHSAQVHLHKFLLTALVMKCLVSSIIVLCCLIAHLPTSHVTTSLPCPGRCPATLLHTKLQPLCHATTHARSQGWSYQSGRPLPNLHMPSLCTHFFDKLLKHLWCFA